MVRIRQPFVVSGRDRNPGADLRLEGCLCGRAGECYATAERGHKMICAHVGAL